ncbi:hypothetical protein GUJ93_ZPchr0010g8906 [Zizania palustris]|uniref:Uncharacterized protein n=1 Tax=Zizania palustris TaxID=103762 RepID=A0A8J5TBM6_ZIZPA|nr:hypothetical protein GUJ93_ZPchr0010g8906 [Zizania palustris]
MWLRPRNPVVSQPSDVLIPSSTSINRCMRLILSPCRLALPCCQAATVAFPSCAPTSCHCPSPSSPPISHIVHHPTEPSLPDGASQLLYPYHNPTIFPF